MKNKKEVVVKQNPAAEVPTEILAESIKQIALGMERIKAGPLNRRALLVLLKDACGVSMCDIDHVLNAMSSLERTYCK